MCACVPVVGVCVDSFYLDRKVWTSVMWYVYCGVSESREQPDWLKADTMMGI